MTWYKTSEETFRGHLYDALSEVQENARIDDEPTNFVTGPGRSGALAAVYASYYLSVPFIPFKHGLNQTGNLLIVDTVRYSGRTLDQAVAWYEKNSSFEIINQIHAMDEIRGHYYQFWYENGEKTNGRVYDAG